MIHEHLDLFGDREPLAPETARRIDPSGLSDAAFQACLNDKAGFAAVQARSQRHFYKDKVDSTPTFLVNGKRIEGVAILDALTAAIAVVRRGA